MWGICITITQQGFISPYLTNLACGLWISMETDCLCGKPDIVFHLKSYYMHKFIIEEINFDTEGAEI